VLCTFQHSLNRLLVGSCSWQSPATVQEIHGRAYLLSELGFQVQRFSLPPGEDPPKYGIEKAPYIEEARERLGPKAAKEMDVLLEQNVALFAGGALDQEAKDAFFEAVMKAYLKCKEEARKTYGRKKETD